MAFAPPASLGLTQLQVRLLLVQDGANAVLPLGTGLSITFIGIQAAAITALDFAIA